VYLFHFDQRYEHAGHYTSWAEDLDHRVAEHLAGRGARLIEVITQAGISFQLARTWPGVTRARERQLKRQGGASRHCPICQDDRKARGLPRRPSRDRDHGQGDQRPNRGQGHQQWAPAVPTRGTRPDRVRAFLELNLGFAARASFPGQAMGWRPQPRRGRAARPQSYQRHLGREPPALPARVATVTRRAVQARLQARQERTAHSAEQTRSRDLAARTHQRLLAHQRRQAAGGRRHRTREERDRER
jgi:hypothetical protein